MRELPVLSGAPSLAYDVTAPEPVNSGCSKCSLSNGVRSVCMPAEVMGPEHGPVLLALAQAPGQEEDRSGRPMSGPTGSYFRALLQKLWKGPVVLDNALRCAPGARELKPKMVELCRPYGVSVYQSAKPARVLAMGAPAIRSVVGESFSVLSCRRGYAHLHDGTPVFFLMHPVMALRNRFARAWFESDLEWALAAEPQQPMKHSSVFMVTTRSEAEEAALELRSAGGVTWDIETFGAPFNHEFVVLNLALTPYGSDFAYELERDALEDPHVFGPLRAVLEDHSVPKCGQGLKFDLLGMRAKFNLRTSIDFDTELMHRLFDAEAEANLETIQTKVGFTGGKQEAQAGIAAGAKDLQRLRRARKSTKKKPGLDYDGAIGLLTLERELRVGAVPWVVPPTYVRQAIARLDAGDEHERFSYAAIEPTVRSRYNGADTISTERLRQWLSDKHKERPDIQLVWENIGRKLTHAITQMEWNGLRLDIAKVRELQKMCSEKIAVAEAELKKHGSFNPNSHPQLAKFFFEQCKLSPIRLTDGGKPSVDADVLGQLNHPAAAAILELRRATHFKSQYADGMEYWLQDDGRIHPNYQIAGTGTGRPSARDPNMFNLPRPKTPDGKLCREIVVAEPGKILFEADYNQQELRVGSMLSGDPVMIDTFKKGIDFHLATAKMPLVAKALRVDPALITKDHEARDRAKIINFSIMYDKGAETLAADLGISKRQAQEILDAILGGFKRFKAWRDEMKAFAQRYGYCRTWWDGAPFRIRSLWHIADGDGEAKGNSERSSFNTPVQGTAAEYMNASLGAAQEWLDKSGAPAKLILTVYDSILLEVEDNKTAFDDVAGNVKRIMEGWNSQGVPLLAEMKIGHSWGSLSSYVL